jgi:hypothetical protein
MTNNKNMGKRIKNQNHTCTIHRNTTNLFIPLGSNIQFSTNTEKEQEIITDRTLHNKKYIYFIWYTDTLMKNLLNFENELIENRKS